MATGKLTPKDRLKLLEIAQKDSKKGTLRQTFSSLLAMVEGVREHVTTTIEINGDVHGLPEVDPLNIELDPEPASDEALDLPPLPEGEQE